MKDFFLNKSIPEIIEGIKNNKLSLSEILKESIKKYEKYENKFCSWVIFDKKKVEKNF